MGHANAVGPTSKEVSFSSFMCNNDDDGVCSVVDNDERSFALAFNSFAMYLLGQ